MPFWVNNSPRRTNRFRFSLRFSEEWAGLIAVIPSLGLTKEALQQKGRELLLRIVSMLSKMVK